MLDTLPDPAAAHRRNGFAVGLPALTLRGVAALRTRIEKLEAEHSNGAGGHDLMQSLRVNGHVSRSELAEVARRPAIPKAVEAVLGPDLLAWSVEVFIKQPRSPQIVSLHHDITKWATGEADGEVTTRIALTDSTAGAGCMRFFRRSRHGGLGRLGDTLAADNLLSRGQSIAKVDKAAAILGPLHQGETSRHRYRCFHASGANGSDGRRIGRAVRHVTLGVRGRAPRRDWAMLVRGEALRGGWDCIVVARGLFQPSDLTLQNRVLAGKAATLTAGATGALGLGVTQAAR